jgi:hypothetical protein
MKLNTISLWSSRIFKFGQKVGGESTELKVFVQNELFARGAAPAASANWQVGKQIAPQVKAL